MVTIQGINFYSVEETAKILGISRKALYNWGDQTPWKKAKNLPKMAAVKAPNGRKFFREDEIIAVLSKCYEIEVTSEGLRNNLEAG